LILARRSQGSITVPGFKDTDPSPWSSRQTARSGLPAGAKAAPARAGSKLPVGSFVEETGKHGFAFPPGLPDPRQLAQVNPGDAVDLTPEGNRLIAHSNGMRIGVVEPRVAARLLKLIALGCNTVETYVAWNAHEPYKGQFDFTGNLDIVAFVELAQSLGLPVIVRPGPYICAGWEFGRVPLVPPGGK